MGIFRPLPSSICHSSPTPSEASAYPMAFPSTAGVSTSLDMMQSQEAGLQILFHVETMHTPKPAHICGISAHDSNFHQMRAAITYNL